MLLKVWNGEQRKAVVADNLQSLIEKGSSKLNLQSNVTVFMEDGTEIDEDEIFLCLTEGSIVYLLQESDEKPWIKKVESPIPESRSLFSSPESKRHDFDNISGMNLRQLPWPTKFIVSDVKFSSDLKTALKTGDLNWFQKAELLHHLAEEICIFTDNPTSSQRKEVATSLIYQYPALKSPIGDGTHAWCIRIYDRMREHRRQKRKVHHVDESTSDDSATVPLPRNKVPKRSRGEINWAPPLPDGEDAISIKAHTDWLQKEWEKEPNKRNKTAIEEKMELCFSSRRSILNNSIRNFKDIKENFPFLFTVDGIMKEFILLMAIDINKTFLMHSNCVAPKLIKLGRQKKKIPQEMIKLLEEFSSIPLNESHVNNTLVLSILILPFLLKEDQDLLYKLYPSETSVAKITCEGPTTPHVAVIGSPFSSSLVFIVAETDVVLETCEFLEAIICLIALYYSCNVEYPKKGRQMFQFMEMELLKLKYQNTTLPRKLSTLLEKLHKM